MTPNGTPPQFLIFQDGSPTDWRIASANARLSQFSGLYHCLDTAVSLLEEAGVTYRVIRFEDTPADDDAAGQVVEFTEAELTEWPVEAIEAVA